jgi:phosphotransferase system enzyme I (PtsI)
MSKYGKAAASSPGIAIGRVQKVAAGRKPIPEYEINGSEVESEVARLQAAIRDSVLQLDEQQTQLSNVPSKDPMLILDSHRMLMLDPQLGEAAVKLIRKEHINAEWALRRQLDHIEAIFDQIEDEYLRSKKTDVEEVGQRVMHNLLGSRERSSAAGDWDTILVGEGFGPSEVVQSWQQGLAGFVTEQGGANSHTIIVARGIGIPALMGCADIMDSAQEGDTIIIDGNKGIWILNPSSEELTRYQRLARSFQSVKSSLKAYAKRPSLSADGHPLPIMANLEFIEELPLAKDIGVEGVGLYRTEFLFLNRESQPSEEEQFLHYLQVVQGMDGKPVTFRLLDIGGDKPAIFRQVSGHQWAGDNPAMGMRGIRLLLHCPDILTTQLRALIRAAMEGPINILVPMVSNTNEMVQTRSVLEKCKQELGCPSRINLGAMIEVPAAALIADELAKVCDFFSVGTNDLIQYTLAADRGDEEVAAIYDPGHEAVHNLLRITAQAARQAGIPIAMCGEMAGDPAWTETLLRMGFDSLSMNLSRVLEVRKKLASLHFQRVN